VRVAGGRPKLAEGDDLVFPQDGLVAARAAICQLGRVAVPAVGLLPVELIGRPLEHRLARPAPEVILVVDLARYLDAFDLSKLGRVCGGEGNKAWP
jgi:hypothetical protein